MQIILTLLYICIGLNSIVLSKLILWSSETVVTSDSLINTSKNTIQQNKPTSTHPDSFSSSETPSVLKGTGQTEEDRLRRKAQKEKEEEDARKKLQMILFIAISGLFLFLSFL